MPNGALGHIIGKVTDVFTGVSIYNVTVAVGEARASTDANGFYSIAVPGSVAGSQTFIQFWQSEYNGYSTQRAVPPGTTITLNVQMIPHQMPGAQPYVPGTPSPPTGSEYYPYPTPTTAATPTGPLYGYRIYFYRLSWANKTVADSFTPILFNEAYRIVNENFREGVMYREVSAKLNWDQGYWEVMFEKVGSPPIPPLVIGIAIIAAIIAAGIVIYKIAEVAQGAVAAWTTITTAEGLTKYTEQVNEMVKAGQVTPAQGVEMIDAYNKGLKESAAAGAGTKPAAWTWPTTENLMPIILVVAIVGAFAVAYGFLRGR